MTQKIEPGEKADGTATQPMTIELDAPTVETRPARPVKFESEIYYFYGDKYGKRYNPKGLDFGERLKTLPKGIWESWIKIRCLDGRYAMNSVKTATVNLVKAQRNGAQSNPEKEAAEQYQTGISELLLAIEDWSEMTPDGKKAPIEESSLQSLPAWLFSAFNAAHNRTNALSGN